MISFHKHLSVLIAVFGSIWFFPAASEAATALYITQASFDAAVPGAAPLEDFHTAPNNQALLSITLPSGIYSGNPNVFVTPPSDHVFTYGAAVQQPLTQFILTADGNENITVNFAAPIHAVGFDAFFNGLGPLEVSFFGVGGPQSPPLGVLTATFGFDPATNAADKGYLGFSDDVNLIYGFTWLATGGQTANTGFTNISVKSSLATPTVPLPTALPLFATGLAGLGLLGWRRKRKAAA
jgi:hypothetical protein